MSDFTKIFLCVLIGSLLVTPTFINRVQITSASNTGLLSSDESYILVDQFGYRPNSQKRAVIIQTKTNSDLEFQNPHSSRPTEQYQVIEENTGKQVYIGNSQIWQDGTIHKQSGVYAAVFDFSLVNQPGSYVIKNAQTGDTSAIFSISEVVYQAALVNAARMYFYQRSGFPKYQPFADQRWVDDPAFLGRHQDTEARYVYDKANPKSARDMRGGWFDAGDMNKYVTFASPAVHQLLDAYSQNKDIWTDDFRIPESGNGIPDLLDEIIFEIDWLKRMQDTDGGVFIKIGNLDFRAAEKPSLDRRPRYYGPKCSSSTIDTAGMFSHAAMVFEMIPGLESYSNELKQRALEGWDWYQGHPKMDNCDTQEIKSGDADRTIEQQKESAIATAIYLFALTNEARFSEYVSKNLEDSCIFCYGTWYPYHSVLGDALLYLTSLNSMDIGIRDLISSSFSNLISNDFDIYGDSTMLDPFGAFMPDDQYHWGSNLIKALFGISNFDALIFTSDQTLKEEYKTRAENHLHYLHGVNPLGIVYLTNMYNFGAKKSANEMFHEWFGKGVYKNARTSPNGPPPGYLTGGPNKNYSGIANISREHPMSAYVDSSDAGEMKMWEITEPAIYYQSAYLKLLSNFVSTEKYEDIMSRKHHDSRAAQRNYFSSNSIVSRHPKE